MTNMLMVYGIIAGIAALSVVFCIGIIVGQSMTAPININESCLQPLSNGEYHDPVPFGGLLIAIIAGVIFTAGYLLGQRKESSQEVKKE